MKKTPLTRKTSLRRKSKKPTRIKVTLLDKEFSQLVRARAGWKCEVCGREYGGGHQGLHCAHYFGRANRATRWRLSNAISACYGCHRRFHANPHEHYVYMLNRLGTEGYAGLVRLAATIVKPDLDAVRAWIAEEKARVAA